MLFTVRTTWQQFGVLALFTVASVACYALGNDQAGAAFAGMAGGALTVSRSSEEKSTAPIASSSSAAAQ